MKRYVDPKLSERCQATIRLKDGSQAQCGRRRKPNGCKCWQHQAIQPVLDIDRILNKARR